MVLALGFFDWEIVNAGNASAHQTLLIKFPILVAIAAEPIATVVMPFVGKPYRYTVLTKCPNLLDEAVIQLFAPLARQKLLDRLAALKHFGSVAPSTVERVGECNPSGVARIPCIFGHAGFLRGALDRERRKWRAAHLGPFVCYFETRGLIITSSCPNVRFWHKADMTTAFGDVCFLGE